MKRWSLVLFSVGIVCGLILITLATWADQEASLFESTSAYDTNLPTLRCPVMIAHDENSAITVTLKNPSTYPVSPLTTAHITSGFVMLINSFEELPSILPGGKATYSWPIVPADAAYKTLILARVFVASSYPNPSRTGSCGVYVLPFGGIPGRAVATLLLILCLAGMSLGLYFWRGKGTLGSRRSSLFAGMLALAGLTIVGLLSILIGSWPLGLASLILVLLIAIALVTRYWGEV
jgi:hypothetical protein